MTLFYRMPEDLHAFICSWSLNKYDEVMVVLLTSRAIQKLYSLVFKIILPLKFNFFYIETTRVVPL